MSSAKRIILMTGANTGLGFEAAKALYNSSGSYTLLLGGRSIEKAEAAVARLQSENAKGNSTASAIQVDVCSDDSINKCFEAVSQTHGKLDVLVNNAGAAFDNDIARGKLSMREGWNKSWDTNVAGTQVMTHTFVPLLLKSSDPRLIFMTSGTSPLKETEDASVRINVSPPAGWPKPASPNEIASYRSAKTGMNMMMREWHRVLRNDGVKVWCVSPGFLATGLGGAGQEMLKKMGAGEPHIGGEFLRDVIMGQRDADVGLCIRKDGLQPW